MHHHHHEGFALLFFLPQHPPLALPCPALWEAVAPHNILIGWGLLAAPVNFAFRNWDEPGNKQPTNAREKKKEKKKGEKRRQTKKRMFSSD